MIPASIDEIVRTRFRDSLVEEAHSVLALLEKWETLAAYETLLAGVLQLSGGDIERLRYFVDRAWQHPSDIIGITSWNPALGALPRDIDEDLLGGPLGMSVPRELLKNQSHDLWTKTAFNMVCVVCDKLVSRNPFANPEVILTRPVRGGTETHYVTAHRRCMQLGKQRAAEQGYGWEEVGSPPRT